MIDDKLLLERTNQLIHEVLKLKEPDEDLRKKLTSLRNDIDWYLDNSENNNVQ